MNNDNIQKEKNNEANIIEIDDRNDNDDYYYNLDKLIFNDNKNSNSKSNMDNVDENNANDFSQFEPNNDYQNDNYNSIFSQISDDKN